MLWVYLGEKDSIPKKAARVVFIKNKEIAVFRTENDHFFALKNQCPHKKGPLSEGIIHGTKVTCPLHNWVIDLNTGKATYPDDGCTENYQIELRTEGLFLGFNLETKTAEIQAIQ